MSAAIREALQRIVDWDAAGMALTEDHLAQARAALAATPPVPSTNYAVIVHPESYEVLAALPDGQWVILQRNVPRST